MGETCWSPLGESGTVQLRLAVHFALERIDNELRGDLVRPAIGIFVELQFDMSRSHPRENALERGRRLVRAPRVSGTVVPSFATSDADCTGLLS